MRSRRARKSEYWVEQAPPPKHQPGPAWDEVDQLIREQYRDMARDARRSLPVKPNKFRQHRKKA